MLIYKILRAPEWAELKANGTTKGAPIDLADGYVHFSAGNQVEGTLSRHFAGEDGLVLLGVEADTLGADLIWEVSRGDTLFPHLYRELRLSDVTFVQELAPPGTPDRTKGIAL